MLHKVFVNIAKFQNCWEIRRFKYIYNVYNKKAKFISLNIIYNS